MYRQSTLKRTLTSLEREFLKTAEEVLQILHSYGKIKQKIKIYLCKLTREDINALTNCNDFEILINLNSPIIKNIMSKTNDVQKVLLIEELSHEVTHLLGYGLDSHDLEFFKMHRVLKYKAMLNC